MKVSDFRNNKDLWRCRKEEGGADVT